MQKELIESNPILKHTVLFSLMVIEYCEALNFNKKYIISNQLLRSATSIGANAMEAQNAESKADFIHKMKILQKKQMKPNTGYRSVNLRKNILIVIT